MREMGVGDLGVARRVRQMSEAYMGRLRPIVRIWMPKIQKGWPLHWPAISAARKRFRIKIGS